MKRIRTTAALMTISVGAQAASSDETGKVAFLSAPFCTSLREFFIDSGEVDPAVRGDSINIEFVGPPPLFNPLMA